MTSGVTGVMGNVAGLLTGAAGPGGFRGSAGASTGAACWSLARASRATCASSAWTAGGGVDAAFRPEIVPPAPEMRALMPKVLSGGAAPGGAARVRSAVAGRAREAHPDRSCR